uniref:Uncharacterized protein n=1 Tax=Lepeophtheirus salmonis TaxID=72036 RepID=A0A0K2T3H0_LEPSM
MKGNLKNSSLLALITTPLFYVHVEEFPVLWEDFDTLIHLDSNVISFYKYRYLRQSLRGRASHCLDYFYPLTEYYENTIKYINNCFGQPRAMVRNII